MMTFDEYVQALIIESERFADAVAAAGPEPIPASCPEWSVRDLALHLGEVQRWARYMLINPGQKPPADVAGPAPTNAELDGWLRAGSANLVDTLQNCDPDGAYFTFLVDPPAPRVFWARRQAHEVAMHRVDAQIALGVVDAFEPDFAADGIDEILTGMVPRKHIKLHSDRPLTMVVAPVDTPQRWRLTISNGPAVTTRDGDGSADSVVTGYANDILLVLWNRTTKESLDVSGDADILGLFSQSVQIRWA
jgi:uncharacterized protein (TIGR03083 family)